MIKIFGWQFVSSAFMQYVRNMEVENHTLRSALRDSNDEVRKLRLTVLSQSARLKQYEGRDA